MIASLMSLVASKTRTLVAPDRAAPKERLATSPGLEAQLADKATIDLLFKLVLGRAANQPEYLARVQNKHDVAHWITTLLQSEERKQIETVRFKTGTLFARNRAASAERLAASPGLEAQLANKATIDLLFNLILGRAANQPEYLERVQNKHDVAHWITALLQSEEREQIETIRVKAKLLGKGSIADPEFRAFSLRASSPPSRVLITGSCLTDCWKPIIEEAHPGTQIRRILFNNASELEDLTSEEARAFDFQIAQIPIRSIFFEAEYFQLPATPEGEAQMAALFETACQRLKRNFDAILKYNRRDGIPVCLLNFAVPQTNPLGRLLPRYAFSNIRYFFEELNRTLATMASQETNVHFLDYDAITATLGKRYILDDLTHSHNHGGFMNSAAAPIDIDLTPHGSVDEVFGRKIEETTLAIFNECREVAATLAPENKIKIAIFDLDGTLWRGIPADGGAIDIDRIEGWPLSLVEAAAFLKKRGILVALASKNDPAVVEPIWEALYGSKFPLSAFVSRKISWNAKVDSIREILAETNLLPGNCLFIDDNPIEREKAKRAFPDIYLIDGPICTWRRQLLWARELQVPFISAESGQRTESVKAMVEREAARSEMSDEEFLAGLCVRVALTTIRAIDDPRFPRALELINKTNQFNTTGHRWTDTEMRDLLDAGGAIITAEVSDRYNNYGLTAALLYRDSDCLQMVMSCRTFGLRVEYVLFSAFLEVARSERTVAFAWTDKNGPCRRFLTALGLEVKSGSSDIVNLPLAADFVVPTPLAPAMV